MSGWVRSSFCSGGNCVEAQFVTSSFCTTGTCVEVGQHDGLVQLRDGKLADTSPVLTISSADWSAFLDSVPDLDRQLAEVP